MVLLHPFKFHSVLIDTAIMVGFPCILLIYGHVAIRQVDDGENIPFVVIYRKVPIVVLLIQQERATIYAVLIIKSASINDIAVAGELPDKRVIARLIEGSLVPLANDEACVTIVTRVIRFGASCQHD